MDNLTEVLMAAGEELTNDHNWWFGGSLTVNNPFITVVKKHIEPMIYTEEWRKAKIVALEAELKYWKGK